MKERKKGEMPEDGTSDELIGPAVLVFAYVSLGPEAASWSCR